MPDEKMDRSLLGLTIQISQPYAEGHVLNAAEAKALNQTRAENIGNLLRKDFKEAQNENGEYSPEAVEKLYELIAAKDAEYQFTLSAAGSGRKIVDPIEKEAMSLARARLSAEYKDRGKTRKEVKEAKGEEFEAWENAQLEKIASHPDIIKLAKKRVAQASSMVSDDLALDF